MSFRTNGSGIERWGEEKTYTICMADYVYRISFLTRAITQPTPWVRNDIVFIFRQFISEYTHKTDNFIPLPEHCHHFIQFNPVNLDISNLLFEIVYP